MAASCVLSYMRSKIGSSPGGFQCRRCHSGGRGRRCGRSCSYGAANWWNLGVHAGEERKWREFFSRMGEEFVVVSHDHLAR